MGLQAVTRITPECCLCQVVKHKARHEQPKARQRRLYSAQSIRSIAVPAIAIHSTLAPFTSTFLTRRMQSLVRAQVHELLRGDQRVHRKHCP